MAVYFIQSAGNHSIKIGHGRDPQQRLSDLQCGNPWRLSLLATMPGGEAEEGALHARFAAFHLRGEWFRPNDELDALIEQHRISDAAPPVRPDGPGFDQVIYRIRRYAYDHGIRPAGLAAKTGLALNTLRLLHSSEWNPTLRIIKKIEGVIPADFDPSEAA